MVGEGVGVCEERAVGTAVAVEVGMDVAVGGWAGFWRMGVAMVTG
jgi:hypothetical protein